MQCGAAASARAAGPPAWRPLAAIAAATALLLGGAAAAAYAALSRPTHKAPVHVALATVPAPTTSTPATSTPLPSTPLPSTPTPGTPGTNRLLPPVTTKAPKIPTTTPTPSVTGTNSGGAGSGESTTTTTQTSAATTPAAPPPTPILLDTDAAATYNPYGYRAANFGDPSLAIDGETTTAWTATVDSAVAPRMAEGLVIDLRTARHLGSLEAISGPVGATVEAFGANGHTPPATITDPTWKKLNGPHVLKKAKATLKLHAGSSSYRFVVLWLTKAPAGAAQVSIRELALFSPLGAAG